MNDQMNKIINKVSAVTSAARNQTRQMQNEPRAASSSRGAEPQSFESPQSSSSRLQRIRSRAPASNFTRLGNFSSNSTRVRYDPSNPTLQSTLSQMYSVAGNDKNKWNTLYNMFQRETQISTSPIYSPYLFNAPATNPEYAAKNEAATQKFEAQWADAKAKAAYWAGRTDLNLSDDDIIARVNLDGYSEIKALNKKISEGSTGYYTRSLGYSPDVLYGVIWAARNGGSTGNDLVDLMNYARGEGKGYERNEDIQARLDPTNERYNPYSVGSTADDLASYFGVAQFDSDWLAKNRYLLNGDDNDVKRYQQVYIAEQTTQKAEAEYAELQKRMDSWFNTNVDDPNIILENLFGKDDVNGTDALSTLGKMDESLKSGKIMSMTRPVDYSYAEVVRQVQEHCDEVRAQKKTAAVADEISMYTGAGNTATAADTSIDTARDNALLASGRTIRAMGTGEEKLVFSTSRSGFERYMQQVRDAVSDGKGMSAEQVYEALLNGANQYAAQNYLAAREAFGNLSLDQMDEFSQKYGVAGLLTSDAQVSARAQLDSIRDSYILAAKLNDGKGADTSMLHLMDYLYDNGREYTPTEWSATTAFQMLIDSGSYTREQVAEGARETISQKQAKIDEIAGVLEQVQNAGIKGADKYVSNLERMRDAYQQDVDDAKYFLIPEEAEDFKQVVNKYKFDAKEAWKGFDLFAGFKSEKNGIPQFDYQLVTLVNEKTGRRGIHDNSQDRYVNFLTDDEIDTYLYLSATQGYDKAQEYYNHLKEETLPVRAAVAASENTADIASSGLLGAAAMSAMSVLASPAQVAGTAYSAIQGIRGEEINPYHGSFAANMFISSARGTVKNEISETLGEDTGWAKFANMTYDALMSSGDSLLSGAVGMGSNVASVLFMGAEAAGGAVMDAKMRGATDTQALLMGGISWAAESLTEFIPMDNIIKAFKGGSAEAARGLVSRVIRSAFEEAPGEMASEIIEGLADDLIMREMSERNLSVQEYIASGMDAEEAERKATADFVKNVLYAGATGALSGAMSTGTAWLGGKLAGNGTQTETQVEALRDAEQRTADVQTVPEAQTVQTSTQNAAGSEIVANATENINKGFESVYSQLAALSTAQQTQDKATQASVISGVFESYGVDAETARAAGQMLVDRINGNRLIGAMEKMLYSSIEQGINASDTMKAVAYSGLSDGYAGTNQILEISAQPTESISGDVLNSFIQSNLANAEGTMQQMQKRVTDNAIANAMREIVADGGLDGIRTYETALQQAEQNVRTANEGLARVTAERDAAGQNLQDIQAKFVENPADPQMAGAMQQAIRDMEGKAKVVAEYQQSVAKFENQRQVAETTLNNARETAMKQVRQEAVQRVMEQRAALAEEAALRDAQVQQLAEEAVAANAQVQENARAGYQKKAFIPYDGPVPQQVQNTQRETTVIDDANFAQAQQILSDAQQEAESPSGVRSLVKAAYRALFGERFNQKQVTVDNVQFDGQPYTVTIFKNLINKVVSDPNLSAEKMSVLSNIEQTIKNSEYLTSSGVDRSSQTKKDVARYDYLSSGVKINGTDYNAVLTIEVYDNNNKMKTYRLENIEMTPTSEITTGYVPTLRGVLPGEHFTSQTTGYVPGPQGGASSADSVAQNAASVNPSISNSTVQYSYGSNGEQAQGTNSAPVVSPVETARTLAKDLGIGAALGTRKMDIAYRNSVPNEVRGYYEQRAKYMAVREGDASSYSVTMHEAGHAIADKTGLTGTQEMIDHLAPEFAKNYSADKLGREAFAEFTRLYMQDSTQAETFAGREFMQQFETALRNAGIDKAVHTARDRIQAYVNANTLARVRASWIDQADTIKKGSLAEREAEFVTNVFDWTRPFEDVDKAVNRQTGEYGNLRTIAKRRNFSDRVVSNLFTNALTDVDGNIIGDSFASAFSEIDARSADDFISYALMKHALDRDVQSKQVLANDITAEQMRRQIAQLEEASPEYKRALTKFENTWNQFMQAWMVDTGLLSQADFDAMRAMYPNYLPTQRYLGTESGYRRGRNTFTVRRATGSDLQVINPLDSIANYVNRIVDTVYKNNAALAWHEAYQTTEGLGEYAREITSDMRRESVNTENIQERVRQILEESGADSDVVADVLNTIGTEAVAWRDTGTSTEGNVLAVRLPNGESAYYQFTREGRLLYDALTGNGKATAAQRGPALRAFAKLTGAMSKMMTTYAPTFAASNPIKDIQSSINYGSWAATYGDGIFKWLRGFKEVWKESGEYKNYLAMGGGGWNSVNTGTRASTDDFRAKLFDNYWKRNTGNKLRNVKNRAAHVGQKALEVVTLNRLNEIIENTSRYVEYRFGKNDTSTAEGRMKAFQAAQDVTTDFANGGKGKGVIAARSLVPFLNPNLQGTYRAVRELSGRERGRLGARMGKRVLNTGMAVAVAAVLRNMLGKDDDKEHFANISDEIKATHLIIPNILYKDSDRRFIRIPISQDPFDQLVHALFESAVEQYDGTDDFTTELLAAASAIVSNVTLGASDLFEEGDIEERLNGIMSGTTLGPLWGLVTNQNYYGGQIVSDRLKELSAPLQYDDTTPELFKFIGRLTGASPKALEYLVDQYGGYGGQLFVNTVSSAMDNNFNLLDVVKSVTGSFHKRFTIDSAYTNDISSAYSANRNFLTLLKNNVSKTNTDGGLLRGSLTEDERKQAYEEAVAMTSKGGLIYETNKKLSELWTQVNEVKDNANLTDAERNRLILSYRDEIARKQMAVNDAMTDYCDKYVYTPNLFERIFKDIHEVTPYTTREKLSDIFQADSDKDYMQKATNVWEATGKDSALPHPNTSFDEQKTTYEIGAEDWDGWETAYRDAYENYVARNASKWDGMTDEEKLGVLTKAHSEGHNAAKAWYWQTHEKPKQTDK